MSIGPLTSTFTPPADCAGTDIGVIRANSGSSYFVTAGAAASSCFPSGSVPDSTGYYSPGLCLHGYTAACVSTHLLAQGNGIETVVTCCPNVYTFGCFAGNAGTDWGPADLRTATTSEVVLGPNATNALPRLSQSSTDTAGRLTVTSPIINAIGVQIRYQSTDSAVLGSASSIIPSTSTGTPQPSSASGLTGGAIAGIVIGVIVALALIVGACIYMFMSKRRKAKIAQDGQTRGLDQTGRKLSIDPDATSQAPKPFVKPELPGSTPANINGEKPELVGSQVWNDALPSTWQHTSATARDIELPAIRDPAELEHVSRPAELRG